MKTADRTLYWEIAGVYLLLLLAFCAVAIILIGRQIDGFLGEVEQRLNLNLASHLAHELAPSLSATDRDAARAAVRRITAINPGIDIYLLAPDGRVTASFTGKPPLRDHVNIGPIRQFIKKDAMLPVRATDPGKDIGEKVFSAAAMPLASGGGYVYVILPGMPVEAAMHLVRTSYIIRGAAAMLAAVLLSTLIAGLILFSTLTRRFRRLTATVKRFQEGAFNERAEAQSHDQIGRLGATFNEMAAVIEHQFEALKRTDNARRAFAANISHDFRTPLTALRGYAGRLIRAEERLTPQERRQHLAAVLKSAVQLEHLADQLAMIVQLESTDNALKLETFSIAELAQDAIMTFALQAEQSGINLVLLNPERVPNVMGDIALIERALASLIDNALAVTPRGGQVDISLPTDEGHVTICVRDTGRGIMPEEVPLLTQRFFRTRQSRQMGLQGTGLGLSIVDEIVTKHGGQLKVESRVDGGSTFSFELASV